MTTVKPSTRPSITPFFRLDQAIGWRQSLNSEGILNDVVNAQLRLGKPGDFPISPTEPFGSFGGMTLPRGVTVSKEGQVLLVDPSNNRILYHDNLPCEKASIDQRTPYPFRELWTPSVLTHADNSGLHELIGGDVETRDVEANGVYDLLKPEDVVFSPDGNIVVADTGHRRVIIYSWPELRVRQVFNFSGGSPVALAYDSRQRLYVADAEGGKIWRIGRLYQIDKSYIGGQNDLTKPSALAIDDQDNVLVLDQNPSRIVRIVDDGLVTELDPLSMDVFLPRYRVPPFHLNGVSSFRPNEIILEYPQIDKPHCAPLLLNEVAVDKRGSLIGTALPLLARPRNIRFPRNGVYISEQLDNEEPSSQWHRVVLEGYVPATGMILVQTHTTDRSVDETELVDLEWSTPAQLTADSLTNTMEVLVQSGRGRYLRLRIELLGDGNTTPTISNIQVFGPRHSSLQYLPPPFHQDPESAYFLDRFLSYFDTIQDEVRYLMSDFTRYLDPQGVPAGPFLEWLGSWFDWKFLAQWPTDLRREMISRSIEFFKQRGTLQGLKQMLQWHTGLTGDQPQIIEHYRLRDYSPTHELFIAEKPQTPLANEISHWFTVVMPVSVVPDEASYQLLVDLIESQIPAHTAFKICIFSPGLRIGKQSSIGIDTWLGHYPVEPLGALNLGQSSRLSSPTSPGFKIGQ